MLFHLRWTLTKTQEAEANSALNVATNLVAERAQAQMNAVKEQGIGAHALPGLREEEAKVAAALQRLTIARSQIEEEAERLRNRKAELEKRLLQAASDIARKNNCCATMGEILDRLDVEEARLKSETATSADTETKLKDLFVVADAALKERELSLSKVTAERAEAAALRSQLERTLQDAYGRKARLDQQLSGITREADEIAVKIAALADPVEKKRDVDAADAAIASAETAVQVAEKSVETAPRERNYGSQACGNCPRGRSNGIETEARHAEQDAERHLVGPVSGCCDDMRSTKASKPRLGAALGEDLDAPLDRAAPAHWGEMEFSHPVGRFARRCSPVVKPRPGTQGVASALVTNRYR